MPKYVVQTRLECTYSFHGKQNDDTWGSGTKEPATPIFFPSEWLHELGPSSSMSWTIKGDVKAFIPTRVINAYRPVLISARSEAEALSKSDFGDLRLRVDGPDNFSLNGWHLRKTSFAALSARKLEADRQLRRSFKFNTAKMIAPDIGRHHLEVDQQFELLRWMWSTSKDYEVPAPYRPWTVRRLILGSTPDWSNTNPWITSQADLFQMLANAILGQGHDIYDMWRTDHGLSYGATLSVPAAHYGKAASRVTTFHASLHIDQAIWTAMKDLPGHSFALSPNHMHPKAVVIRGFGVRIGEQGFNFDLVYGYDNETFGSSWRHTLASTRGAETFYETAERALALMHRLVPGYRSGYRRTLPAT